MKKLLNTLYITNPDYYLARERQNIVVRDGNQKIAQYPIHILEGIICFNYIGVSPALMKLCSDNNIQIAFLNPQGRFSGILLGKENGNVLLRREQYRIADDNSRSLQYAKLFMFSKISNSRKILLRALRDHKDKVNRKLIEKTCGLLKDNLEKVLEVENMDFLRGLEGDSAKNYFQCFDEMITHKKSGFKFAIRTKRPPMNEVNAMLSFFYSILSYDCQSALQSVGLDSYVGFFHVDRPGRMSLALDLVEEFRAYLVDRMVLNTINLGQISKEDFLKRENGAVEFMDDGKKKLLEIWQKRKNDTIIHPFLEEEIKIGLLPYVQAMLLSKTIRGEIDMYPPFMVQW